MVKVSGISKKKPKKKFVSRARYGLVNIPIDKGFQATKYYMHNEVDRKDIADILKNYIKAKFSKSDVKAILTNPEYKFTTFSHHSATAYWLNTEQKVDELISQYVDGLKRYCNELLERGKLLIKEKETEQKDTDNIISLSPQQKLERKIARTIMVDLDNLEDAWINDEKADINVYDLFRKHGLGGSATLPIRQVVEGWLLDYGDAYHKRCEQAVEGYAHLKRPELNRRINVCETILNDLDRVKSAAKANRTVRIKRPVTADKQVSKVNYKKEDSEFKLVSITPVMLIGKKRLFTFNTKYKELCEYVTEDPKGFTIKGTTIQNYDADTSRSVKLRKPNEFLNVVQNKTPRQIDVAWKGLTTKTSKPKGRLNAETILLRVFDK
jgi:hypothetical protein